MQNRSIAFKGKISTLKSITTNINSFITRNRTRMNIFHKHAIHRARYSIISMKHTLVSATSVRREVKRLDILIRKQITKSSYFSISRISGQSNNISPKTYITIRISRIKRINNRLIHIFTNPQRTLSDCFAVL